MNSEFNSLHPSRFRNIFAFIKIIENSNRLRVLFQLVFKNCVTGYGKGKRNPNPYYKFSGVSSGCCLF